MIKTLLLHKFRSLLSTLGILFGVASFITMLSIGEGAKHESLKQIESLGINNMIIRGIKLDEAATLSKNLPGLSATALVQNVTEEITASLRELNTEIIAVSPEFQHVQHLKMEEGRFLCPLDEKRKQPVCVIGFGTASRLQGAGKVGEPLRIGKRQYTIVGILKEGGKSAGKAVTHRDMDSLIMIPLNRDKPDLHELILQAKKKDDVEPISLLARYRLERLRNGADEAQFIIPQELLNQAKRTQRTFNLVLGSIAGVSLLVGGIGILNVMLASVYERKHEIGIRRAVGASQRDIVRQFLGETLILVSAGAVIGLAAGVVLSFLISRAAGWPTIITAASIFASFAVSFTVGLFSGLYPAVKAAKTDPIAALRN